MRDARGMPHRSSPEIPVDLRARLEVARLDLLALFRALDRMDLSAEEIPQRLLRQLFERDADYAEAFGRWTRLRAGWIAVPCSAIPSPHWTSCHPRAPSFANTYRPAPILPWNNWNAASASLWTLKKPTTGFQAEIPKTFKHPRSVREYLCRDNIPIVASAWVPASSAPGLERMSHTGCRVVSMSALQDFPRITPFLWFDSNAEEAVAFYLTVFKNSRRLDGLRTLDDSRGPKGSILTIAFELDGQKFTAINGGPIYRFTEAVSFVVRCDSQIGRAHV